MSKKIVFTIDTNTSGGAERVISNLANYFASKPEYCVTLINSDCYSDFYPLDKRVHILKMRLDTKNTNKVVRVYKKFKYLKEYFETEHPDAVVTFLFNMEAPTILAGIATNTRIFTSVRNSPVAYPKRERAFRKFFYPKIEGVVFQSSRVMGFDDFKKVKNKTVIQNPLSDAYTIDEDIVEYSKRKKWIINVGRLNTQKNQKILIEAFNNLASDYPDTELHIFGAGDLEADLKEYALKSAFHNRIHFEGVVEDAIKKNKNAYIFVMSSNYEGFPNALAEAMACGIPVVCTDFDSGVASELINNGDNGYLARVNDSKSLEHAIREVLEAPAPKYQYMANKNTAVRKSLSIDNIGKQWEVFLFGAK